MTGDERLRTGVKNRHRDISDKKVIDELIENRGDILQTAKSLRMSVREFDNIMRAIPGSAAALGTIERVKASNPEWDKESTIWFEKQTRQAMSLYRLTALEELYALATMPLSDNAAMMNVKREAALNLLGREKDGGEVFPELAGFFKALNEDYKVKSVNVTRVRAELENRQGRTLTLDSTATEISEAAQRS